MSDSQAVGGHCRSRGATSSTNTYAWAIPNKFVEELQWHAEEQYHARGDQQRNLLTLINYTLKHCNQKNIHMSLEHKLVVHLLMGGKA